MTLTDSEFTSLDSYRGASKKRKLAPGGRPRAVQEIRSDARIATIQVPDEDYSRLRLQLVDSVAKAMQLDFHNLPLPSTGTAEVNNRVDEQLMIKRTFFRAHSETETSAH